MAGSDFENNLNSIVPLKVGLATMPSGGNATAGKYPRFTGNGLIVEQVDISGASSNLPTDAAGFLMNDGVGNLSWLKIYIESNADLVYTVSNVGGGGQYNSIQSAVDAIQATGNHAPTYIIQIFPGVYTDPNISVDGYTIIFVGSLLTGIPIFGGQSVEFKYLAAPISGSGYINLISSTVNNCLVSFIGIQFTHTNSAVVTTSTNLFYIASGGSSSSVVQVQFIYSKINASLGHTDSTLFRSDSTTQQVNLYSYNSHFIHLITASATTGSLGYMSMILFTANKAAILTFDSSSFSTAMSHASVAINIPFNLRATTVAQNITFTYCKDIQILGRSTSGNTSRLISILGTGSVNFLYSALTMGLSYNIDVVYFNGASGASVTLRESSMHYLTNTGGVTTIAQSATYTGGTLNVFGGTITTAANVIILGTNMSYGTGSSFLSTLGDVTKVTDGTSYGLSKSAGIQPTFAREDHSHGTPLSIMYGGTKITISYAAPSNPHEGDLWIDIN